MKTDTLIDMLARGPVAVDAGAARRRFAAGLGWGGLGAVLLMAILLGVRPDLFEAAHDPMFWVKLGFVTVMAGFGLPINLRLARPGARLGPLPLGVFAPVAVIWLMATLVLARAPASARPELLWGDTWATCPLNIAMLSLPAFALLMWAMRGMAPTRPRLAGAAVGVLAGSVGAMAYALHCPEMSAPFLAVWYVAGVAVPAAVGALLGPRILRW
ncbi:MAG TPA: DUF1109 domain-containing protein [Burkholderiaceae bacterium]|jgi:hypothetical protein|nr:DUF1109 domain-containing protein [Burkholderiaceae bacterium]